jgi:hypothetical protein
MTCFVRRIIAVAMSAAAVTMMSSGLISVAQEQGGAQRETRTRAGSAKRTFDPTHRVPRYFGDIGLTTDQRAEIYKIQAKHMPKIQDLEKQIDELRAKMVAECETVLTDSQKQMLAARRKAASEARKSSAARAPQ